MTERRLAIVRKFNLADVGPEWESCYVSYRPANYHELTELQKINTSDMDDDTSVTYMLGFIKKHVIGGQVMILDDQEEFITGKLEAADVDSLPPPVLNSLFATISGASLDPKDTPKVVEAAQKSETDSATTETSSSEASVPVSPQQ